MADHQAGVWTWSAFEGGRFGLGYVICKGDAVARVWLPATGEAKRRTLSELDAFFQDLEVAKVSGGAAAKAAKQLAAAIEKGQDVTSLAIVEPKSGPFIEAVWRKCRQIPRGKVLSYKDLGGKAGNASATRAVGNAMAKNPLPLIIPCHRVVQADGSLGNYGGGVDLKRWLLEREGAAVR